MTNRVAGLIVFAELCNCWRLSENDKSSGIVQVVRGIVEILEYNQEMTNHAARLKSFAEL